MLRNFCILTSKLKRNSPKLVYSTSVTCIKEDEDETFLKNSNSSKSSNVSAAMINVKQCLKFNNYDYEDGYCFIKTKCPVCEFNVHMKNNVTNIFINKTTGSIICPTCQHTDEWTNYEKFFNASKSQNKVKDLTIQRQLIINSKKSIVKYESMNYNIQLCKTLKTDQFDPILSKLGLKMFPNNIFFNIETYSNIYENSLYFPFKDVNGMITGYKILGKNLEHELRELTVPDTDSYGLIMAKSQMYSKSQKDGSIAVVVVSILDLLALSSIKINCTILCLPHGFKSLPQQCLPNIEPFSKLILWFNYDVASWDIARIFAKKLGEKRCFIVRPTDLQPAPFKAVQQGIDVKSIINKAEPILHKAITTFSSLRQDVLSDLQNIDKVQGVKWKRFPLLNKYIKGHRKGELTILTGPTGCGKTTFMCEYSLDLSMQGVTTLWGSFEIRNTRLASTLLRQLAGFPLDDNLNDFDYWADAFEELPIYFMTFHGQQTIKVVMETIEHAQYVHDVHHVIIDNLQFMMGTSEDPRNMDRFWRQDAIIAGFRSFATRKNCHVTLVIHPRKEKDSEDLTTNSIFGSAKATQEADNVLIIQDKRLTTLRGKKYLQIAKNRYSGDLGIMPMEFNKNSLSYAHKKKPEDKFESKQNDKSKDG